MIDQHLINDLSGDDDRYRGALGALLLVFVSIVAPIILLLDVLQGNERFDSCIVPFLLTASALALYIVIKLTGKAHLWAVTLLMTVFHYYFFIVGDVAWSSLYWCLIGVPFYFVFLGHDRGFLAISSMFVVNIILLYTPARSMLSIPYPPETFNRYMIAFFIMGCVGYVLEYTQYRSHQGLKQARDKVDVQAKTDYLTGLSNRRGLKVYLQNYDRRASEHEHYSIVVGDLDDFKIINDQFGHDAGDQVLLEVGEILRTLVRNTDQVARWGGEEFIILMTDIDRQGAKLLAEKICKKIAEHQFTIDGESFAVTMSMGVDVQPLETPFMTTFEHADHAMYQAKQSGKNQVLPAWHVCEVNRKAGD